MSIIPDPDQPEKVALDDDGELVFGVFVAPFGTEPIDREAWRHVGWSKGFETQENPAQPSGED